MNIHEINDIAGTLTISATRKQPASQLRSKTKPNLTPAELGKRQIGGPTPTDA